MHDSRRNFEGNEAKYLFSLSPLLNELTSSLSKLLDKLFATLSLEKSALLEKPLEGGSILGKFPLIVV